jgi:hypothetical protein
MRWAPQLIMNGSKILRMVVENVLLLDSPNYLPKSLNSKKRYYAHFFNTANNLDYVGAHP